MSHLISWAARAHDGRTALIYDGATLTFREVDQLANRLAHGLIRSGIKKGDRVAILVANRPEYAVAEFAVAKIGAMRVSVLATSTVAELVRYLTAAECAAAICCPVGISALREARGQLATTIGVIAVECAGAEELDYAALISESTDEAPQIAVRADDPYALRFTGGTTGAPKGVVMSHRNMVATVLNSLLNMPISKSDVALAVHPLTHACGFMMYNYWVAGAKHIISPAFGFKVSAFVETVEKYGVTSIMMIPTLLNIILDAPESKSADFSSIRHIIYGGAPIPLARLTQGLARFGPVFQQIYGLSEAPMFIATLRQEEHLLADGSKPRWFGSVGREALNVEIRIADEQGASLGPNEVGEVLSRGDHTMVGYWRNPELTERRYVDGWVRTGDMAYMDADGYLFLVDRKEDLIITGGFNVWPNEVEEVLFGHPAVSDACVFGIEDDRWGETVNAMVVLRPEIPVSEADIIVYLAERISKFKVPKRVIISEQPLPKSGIGKPLRRVARERFVTLMRETNMRTESESAAKRP